MTWAFWRAYCDEAYAILSADQFGPDAKCPAGFDLATLRADLAIVGEPIDYSPVPAPTPSPTGRMRLYIGILTGLGTDYTDTTPTGCCYMNALASAIALLFPNYDVKIARHGWNEKPPAPYTAGPDGLCRHMRDEIMTYAPDRIILLGHSLGGALLIFWMNWLFTWYSGADQNYPPFVVDLAVALDPVVNAVHFGQGQAHGWSIPGRVARKVLCFVQRHLPPRGTPLASGAGYAVVTDVTNLTNPVLGHIDYFGMHCLTSDQRVQMPVLAAAQRIAGASVRKPKRGFWRRVGVFLGLCGERA